MSFISGRTIHVGFLAARKMATLRPLPIPFPSKCRNIGVSSSANKLMNCSVRLSSAEASDPGASAETVPITYVDPLGNEYEVQAEIGKNLMDIAHDNNIDLEGACGGELACATCHLVFEKEIYNTLPEKLDEEDDMLDLAFELTETSRLGCQICVREDFAGMKVRIPDDGL